ncbi:RraA family protein [Tautonia sociabilis]|uniref:Putative 4-hydroxy-4-methyl-2-oxoglutarate aldolase n=1 Tax=Tautonia sociabilis TaxID=2080755 RepID=A0A432MGD7_9BACT|nr:RraA family protein [Tautonia sociabilis]RUL85623.1 RraA family protein [Tautonia sociabilis]
MSYTPLAPEAIERLKAYNTPTVSNAIEVFNVRPRHVGFLPHRIRSLTPGLGVMVGYAVTSQTKAAPDSSKGPDLTADYLRYVASQPGPKVAVGQDLDDEPGLGAQFGEVNATIHKKLGCVGHITDGCPRDVDEVEAMGFHLFGLNLCVSHAYVRLVDFGKPVTLAGVEIKPGDLIHADKHGVCIIPIEIADRVADACAQVEQLERPLLDCCRGDDFDLERYIQLRADMKAKVRE